MNAKYSQALVIVVMGAITLGSFSVMGLLQSTERIGASGIIIRPVETPIGVPMGGGYTPTPPPPEPAIEIDVYCSKFS